MSLLSLFYPKTCRLCGGVLPDVQHILCESCLQKGEYYFYKSFRVDGADGADAPLVYQGFVRRAMQDYKFRGKRSYADWFAQMTGDCLEGYWDEWQPDCVTFVPLGLKRWLKRGYNQSAVVSRLVAKRFSLPCVRTMTRRRGSAVQSTLTHEARAANVQHAFALRKNVDLTGKRVLLLDEGVTTGSTVTVCTELLRQAGAQAVFVLGMTKTPPRPEKGTNSDLL